MSASDNRQHRLEHLLGAEFEELSLRNERHLARVIILLALCGIGVASWVLLALDQTLGLFLIGLGLLVGAYYWLLVPRLLRATRHRRRIQAINVSLEVSLPAIISLVDIWRLGGEYALTSTPPLLAFVAVIASGLRLRKGLCLYAGFLGTLQYLLVYTVGRGHMDPATLEQLPTLGWGLALNHAGYLLGSGVLAALVAHAGSSMTRRVALQVVAKERLGDLFGEYVSPALLRKVDAGQIALGGEQRRVTILFADIREFTSLSFSLAPGQVVDYLNTYFTAVCDAIRLHGGMVNKFIGDGILAVFGAPDEDPDHAAHAAEAALDMLAVTGELTRPDGQTTRIGVGLHTGEVVLGSIGSARRKDYTVIGDTVNLASRLEGLTKVLGQPILMSATTREAAGARLLVEDQGRHRVKGRDEEVSVFALIGREDDTAGLDAEPGDGDQRR